MPTKESETQQVNTKKRKSKKSNNTVAYLILFVGIFLITLSGVSYLVNLYSPEVDVTIGNDEQLTFNATEVRTEEKKIDERLKWIQQEDELQTSPQKESTKRKKNESKDKESSENNENNKKNINVEKDNKNNGESTNLNTLQQNTKNIEHLQSDFRRAASNSGVVPYPTPLINKVIIGNFSTIEDAMSAQQKISQVETGIIPFVKAENNYYVVQIGSFSNKEKADLLVDKMRLKGFNAKVISTN